MDWTEMQSCIKCNSGGKLLYCNEEVCHVAVHEKCMGCQAVFDDMGNFCCPYCLYKRALVETRQLRNKAMLARKDLSLFLDAEMIEGNHQKLKSVMGKKKETDDFVRKSKDGYINRCGQISDLSYYDKSKNMVVHQAPPKPTPSKPIAAGSGDFAQHRVQGITHQVEVVEVGRRVQAERPSEFENCHNKRDAEVQQGARVLNVEKETAESDAALVLLKMKLNNSEVCKENGSRKQSKKKENGSRTDEDQMEEQVVEATVSSILITPEVQLRSKPTRGVDEIDSTCRNDDAISTQRRNVVQRHADVLEPQYINSPRRSSRSISLQAATNAAKRREININSSLRQLIKRSKRSSTKPNVKRRTFWREEEVDMLKEGVQKFSNTKNKNFPWRKVVDFGRHVFDASRTPSDLKDKWRNILAKESLTK